jgi:hypothetical protein
LKLKACKIKRRSDYYWDISWTRELQCPVLIWSHVKFTKSKMNLPKKLRHILYGCMTCGWAWWVLQIFHWVFCMKNISKKQWEQGDSIMHSILWNSVQVCVRSISAIICWPSL